MAAKKIIWLSYDLGLRGDYPGLYAILDKWKAQDCGPSLAVFQIENSGKSVGDMNVIIKNLTAEIKKGVELKPTDRIYAIWKDDTTDKMKGRFIFGDRKRPVWEGYYHEHTKVKEDSE
jgi:hypothetical protein